MLHRRPLLPTHLSPQQTFSMRTRSPPQKNIWKLDKFDEKISNIVSTKRPLTFQQQNCQQSFGTQLQTNSHAKNHNLIHTLNVSGTHKSAFPLVGNCRQKLAITRVKTSTPCNLNCRYDSLCYLYCRLCPFRGYQVGDTWNMWRTFTYTHMYTSF